MKHTISVLVENHFGVLSRIASLFSARGYNIDSLCVGETEDPAVSRMTVVVRGDDQVLEQLIKQLNKVADVIEVRDLTQSNFVEREMVLLRVTASQERRSEIIELANVFRAEVVDVGRASLILLVTGSEGKVEAFVDMMRDFGIEEVVRTGEIAMARSGQPRRG